MDWPLIIAVLGVLALFSFVALCVISADRYDAARERAPRPLRVSEIGEPPHGRGDRG